MVTLELAGARPANTEEPSGSMRTTSKVELAGLAGRSSAAALARLIGGCRLRGAIVDGCLDWAVFRGPALGLDRGGDIGRAAWLRCRRPLDRRGRCSAGKQQRGQIETQREQGDQQHDAAERYATRNLFATQRTILRTNSCARGPLTVSSLYRAARACERALTAMVNLAEPKGRSHSRIRARWAGLEGLSRRPSWARPAPLAGLARGGLGGCRRAPASGGGISGSACRCSR